MHSKFEQTKFSIGKYRSSKVSCEVRQERQGVVLSFRYQTNGIYRSNSRLSSSFQEKE